MGGGGGDLPVNFQSAEIFDFKVGWKGPDFFVDPFFEKARFRRTVELFFGIENFPPKGVWGKI